MPKTEERHMGHNSAHRGVFKDNSTTNVSPVFDATCQSMVGLSLNDCLSEGINMHELIPQIMLRFCLRRLGVISNIKQGFRQITVDRQDQDFWQFLWWKEVENRKVKVLRHRKVFSG